MKEIKGYEGEIHVGYNHQFEYAPAGVHKFTFNYKDEILTIKSKTSVPIEFYMGFINHWFHSRSKVFDTNKNYSSGNGFRFFKKHIAYTTFYRYYTNMKKYFKIDEKIIKEEIINREEINIMSATNTKRKRKTCYLNYVGEVMNDRFAISWHKVNNQLKIKTTTLISKGYFSNFLKYNFNHIKYKIEPTNKGYYNTFFLQHDFTEKEFHLFAEMLKNEFNGLKTPKESYHIVESRTIRNYVRF